MTPSPPGLPPAPPHLRRRVLAAAGAAWGERTSRLDAWAGSPGFWAASLVLVMALLLLHLGITAPVVSGREVRPDPAAAALRSLGVSWPLRSDRPHAAGSLLDRLTARAERLRVSGGQAP